MGTGEGYSPEPQPERCHHCLCLAETQRQAGEWESFVVEKEGSVCPEEAAGLGKLEAGHPRGLHRGAHLAFSSCSPVESRNNSEGRCQLLFKSLLFGANPYRILVWLPGLLARDSGLTSFGA